jgi:hypothetical protein
MGIKEIESLLDLNNNKIKQLYNSWDKGDCSKIGLTKDEAVILLGGFVIVK